MDQQPLQNILSSAQGAASYSARFVAVSKAALDEFSPPAQQLFTVVARHSALVGLDGLLLGLLAIPVPLACLLSFWNVTCNFIFSDSLDDRSAVIALVRNQLFDPVQIDLRFLFGMQLGLAPN